MAVLLGFTVIMAAEGPHGSPAAAAVGPDFYVVANPDPSWLTGWNGGLQTFGGSMSLGVNFFWGSTIPAAAAMEVEIRISASESTLAQTYRLDQTASPGGVGVFPGSAWDISDPSNPRRLNVIFVEDNNQKPANLKWDPDGTYTGGREYLLIMNSDYDGTGLSYAGRDGLSADVLYGWLPRLEPGYSFHDTDPLTLTLKLARVAHLTILAEEDRLHLFWEYAAAGADSFVVYGGQEPDPQTAVARLPVTLKNYVHTGLPTGVPYYYRIEALAPDGTVTDRSRETSSVPTQTSHRLSLEGLWNGRTGYGDVWGYTAPGGAEYALINVRGAGLSIIDINGDQPVEIGFAAAIADGYPDAKDVKVYDHYAILVNENAPAQVIDLADPANPVTVATIFIGDSSITNGGAHNAFVEGRYLYITGGHGNQQGVHIYDLADPDPSNPVLLGGYHQYYYHDIFVRNDTAYASAAANGIDVLDLDDRTNPVYITNFGYAGQWVHNSWATDDGNYLIVGDENGFSGQWTRIFDIRNLGNPVKVAEIIVDPGATAHNSYVVGDYLYMAHYAEGLRIWDISDPTRPVEAAYFDTYLPDDSRFGGVWSVYPYFASGKIVISDRSSGLIIFKADAITGEDLLDSGVPQDFYLAQNYPNPFNVASIFTYGLPQDGEISLKIYDILGLEVLILAQGQQTAGRHRITWQADGFPSGIYFARLVTADGQRQTIKLTLLK